MTLLAFTLVVVESVWAVALVGIVHITASAVIGILIVRRLGRRRAKVLRRRRGTPRRAGEGAPGCRPPRRHS